VLFAIGVYVYFSASQGPDQLSPAQADGMTRGLFWIAAVAAVFGCIDFAYQLPAPAGFGAQFLWLDSGVYRRAQGLFYEASTLGNFCACFLVMCAVALAEPRGTRVLPTWLLSAGAVLFGATTVLSFSRASLVTVVIALLVLAILEWRRRGMRRLLGLSVVVIVTIAAVLVFALPEVVQTYWSRLDFAAGNALSAPNTVLSGRLATWSRLASFISDHPWQTAVGIGYKTLPYTEHLGKPLVADNMYLSMLVETGVFGLAALVGLNLAILAACWRAARRGSFYGKWMLCFWTGEVFQMLSGDILTYWRVLPVYFWVLAQAVREPDA
jgi:O-antigen ligase